MARCVRWKNLLRDCLWVFHSNICPLNMSLQHFEDMYTIFVQGWVWVLLHAEENAFVTGVVVDEGVDVTLWSPFQWVSSGQAFDLREQHSVVPARPRRPRTFFTPHHVPGSGMS